MKRIFTLVLFACFLFSAVPLCGAMASDTFLYYDALPQVKGDASVQVPVFCDGVWSFEWLDSADGTFSLMGPRQQSEEETCFAAPTEFGCRISEGVLFFVGETLRPCLTFTAPADGSLNYTLFGYFREGSAPRDSVCLYLGEEAVTLWRNDPVGTSLLIDCAVDVKAGDKIRLVVQSDSDAPFCLSSCPTVTYRRQTEVEESDPSVPDPEILIPTGLRLTRITEDCVYIQWDPPAEDLYYNVYVNGERLYSGLHFTQGETSPVSVPCQPGTLYEFSVAVMGEGDSEFPHSERLRVLMPAERTTEDAESEIGTPVENPSVSIQTSSEENPLLPVVWILAVGVGLLVLALLILVICLLRRKS